jgi:phosphatidylglycerophosphatase C
VKAHKVVAAFDFDGTITHTESLQSFLRYASGNIRFVTAVAKNAPSLLKVRKGMIRRQIAKEKILQSTIKGATIEEMQYKTEMFVSERLPKLLRPEMLERVKWHNDQGHRVVLVSASPGIYLKKWAPYNGFHAVLCSELEVVDKKYTGNLSNANCWGPEKVRRLRAWWAKDKPDFVYAYGDSHGDLDMLAIANEQWYQGKKI